MMRILIEYVIPGITFSIGIYSLWISWVSRRIEMERRAKDMSASYSALVREQQALTELVDRRIDHLERTCIEIKTYLYVKSGKDM